MVLISLTNSGITLNNAKKCCGLEATQHFHGSVKWLHVQYNMDCSFWINDKKIHRLKLARKVLYFMLCMTEFSGLYLMNSGMVSYRTEPDHKANLGWYILVLFPWNLLSFSPVFWTFLLVTTELNIKINITCHKRLCPEGTWLYRKQNFSLTLEVTLINFFSLIISFLFPMYYTDLSESNCLCILTSGSLSH